jgi:hypothetical protein
MQPDSSLTMSIPSMTDSVVDFLDAPALRLVKFLCDEKGLRARRGWLRRTEAPRIGAGPHSPSRHRQSRPHRGPGGVLGVGWT